MDPMTWILISSALGLGKGLMDQEKEGRQRKMAAQMMQWSPWTNMNVPMPQSADVLGSTMQGALTGAIMGQQFGKEAAPEVDGTSVSSEPNKYSLGMTRQYKPMLGTPYDVPNQYKSILGGY